MRQLQRPRPRIFQDMTDLDPDTRARIEAEEAYRVQLRAQATPAKKKRGGCVNVGCGGIVLLLLLGALVSMLGGGSSTSSTSPSRAASAPEAAGEASQSPTIHVIKDAGRVGCADREVFKRLVGFVVDGDRAAFAQLLTSSDCVAFQAGEQVFLDEVPFMSGEIKVRRKGGVTGYWTNTEAVD